MNTKQKRAKTKQNKQKKRQATDKEGQEDCFLSENRVAAEVFGL